MNDGATRSIGVSSYFTVRKAKNASALSLGRIRLAKDA